MTRGPHAATAGVLFLVGIFGCSGEQRSSGSATDTTQAANDTAARVTVDTAARPADTTAAAARETAASRSDTGVSRRDTAPTVAAKPAPKKPARPRAAPAPRPDTARMSDTTTTQASAPPDTTTSSSQTASSQTAQAEAPLRDEYHRAPLDTVPQQVYDGWKQFNLNCARCHGEDVQGTTIAPHLIVSVRPDGPINTKELFMQTVCVGRPAKGMPAWCALGMEMPTIEAIYAYVKGRSDGKIHPGRPALRSGG